MKRLPLVLGAVLLVLFVSMIGHTVLVGDERCDFCGATMLFDHATPGLGAKLAIYRCPKCDQRGQREFRTDGTVNWTEW